MLPAWRRFARDARAAHALGAPAPWRQWLEALALRCPPSRLGLTEYHDYRLSAPHLRWQDKRRFVGWRGEPALDRGNVGEGFRLAHDKIALAEWLHGLNLPHPRLHAAVWRTVPEGLGAASLSDAAALARWLRQCPDYPLFLKPSHAGFGRGAFLVERWEAAGDSLVLAPQGRQPVEAFVAGLRNPERKGYLVQEVLRGAAATQGLCGPRPTGLRMMVLKPRGQAARIYRAVWKIPRTHNIVDNFESGSLGNLLGAIDLRDGRVLRVVEGHGLARREPARHPDTGAPLSGWQVPDWPQACALALAAAEQLPSLSFQHWDVALTDRGPVLLEVNLFAAGGTELSQLVDGRGLLEPELLRACRRP